jgi:hypothetical protein
VRRPRVEILYFGGCPNHQGARALVQEVASELRLEPEIALVEIADAEAAAASRFPGSPTVRIDGLDVEPGADERSAFVMSCRVYQTAYGLSALPEADWVREALRRTA